MHFKFVHAALGTCGMRVWHGEEEEEEESFDTS